LALLCLTWRDTVFDPDEWESNVIGDGQLKQLNGRREYAKEKAAEQHASML
jgi:hypothetical protein